MPYSSRPKQRAYMRTYYQQNRNRIRAQQLSNERGPAYWRRREASWRRAGILYNGVPLSAAIYQAVVRFQRDRCALCGRHGFWDSLQADHNHKTGEFRGALCHECNHRAVSVFERTGRFKSKAHETRIRRYLLSPPVEKWYLAGGPD